MNLSGIMILSNNINLSDIMNLSDILILSASMYLFNITKSIYMCDIIDLSDIKKNLSDTMNQSDVRTCLS